MDWIFDASIWASLISLTALEIVLGIDNIVFLSVITNALPADQAHRARQIGLALALLFRIALLFAITWITRLTAPVLSVAGQDFSWRDIILIVGGLFLIVKATQEVHNAIEGEEDAHGSSGGARKASFNLIIGQIVLIDAIFSLDSIITAVGMADEIGVMIAAVCIAIAVMYIAADSVSGFIKRHPTTKMLALAFLMLIGVALVADGFHFHIPRAYIYFAMAFAAGVEIFNVLARRNAQRVPAPIRGAVLRSPAYERSALEEQAGSGARVNPRNGESGADSARIGTNSRDIPEGSGSQTRRNAPPAKPGGQEGSPAGRGGVKAKAARGKSPGSSKSRKP